MTTARYDRDGFRMRIEGHAGAAPAGEDIVCAAATILGWTLIDAATEEHGFHAHLYIDEVSAVIDVLSMPDEEQEQRCRDLYDTIWRGFLLLAERYPDNIQTGGYYG